MNDAQARIPYSKRGLENLAAALNINSAYLWVNPGTAALTLRDSYQTTVGSRSSIGKVGIEVEEEQE